MKAPSTCSKSGATRSADLPRSQGLGLIFMGLMLAARLQAQPGASDPGFAVPAITGGFPPTVNAIAVQADGKICIAGNFTSVAGVPRPGIARLNPDGNLDTDFNPVLVRPATFQALAIQPDNKILAAGTNLVRFNPDGSPDALFQIGFGPNASVWSMALQSDGKILIGGDFTTYNNFSRSRYARLKPDGSFDPTFLPGIAFNNRVRSLVVLKDDTFLVAGDFTAPNYGPILCNTNGTRITTFNPTFPNGPVHALALQANGKILLAGEFTSPRSHIARFNTNGTQDLTFNPGPGANGTICCLAIQSDGKVLIGGNFTSVNDWPCYGLARLQANGNLDTGFNAGGEVNRFTQAIAIQGDGQVLAGGVFINPNGIPVTPLARVNGGDNLEPMPTVSLQATNLFLTAGQKLVLRAFVTSLTSYTCQWQFNGTNLDLATAPVLTLTNIQTTNAGTYSMVVSNSAGRASATAVLQVNPPPALAGKLDRSFNAHSIPSVDDGVMALAWQSDGKVLIGGGFTSFNGVGRTNLARLDADGNLDLSFDPHHVVAGSYPDWVKSIVNLPDGSILVGGLFGRRLARLDTKGNLGPNSPYASAPVNVVTLERNGKSLAGTMAVGGYAYVYRFGTNGLGDSSLRSVSTTARINAMVVQPDDKILIAGDFTRVNAQLCNYIARLNPSGELDTSFNPTNGPNASVAAVAVQPDGKIVIGGSFSTVGGLARKSIARLNPDGTLDASFDPGSGITTSGGLGLVPVMAIVRQPDGKFLIGGGFIRVNGVPRNAIARLNIDGSLDTTFDIGTGANGIVYAIALLPDERIIIGGDFTTFNGIARNRVARLFGDRVPPRLAAPRYLPGVFDLTFESVSGQSYVLEYNNALDGTAWTSGASVAGDGSVKSLADTNAPPAMRFYRVRVPAPGE